MNGDWIENDNGGFGLVEVLVVTPNKGETTVFERRV